MRRSIRWAFGIVCLLGCGNGYDTQAGSGGSGASAESACPENYGSCGDICCAPGKVCRSAGRCEYPYLSADLYVYLCPSFNTGTCQASYLSIDQTCTPLKSPVAGTCYNTGFKVAAGASYGISSCTACAMGCGNPGSVTMPAGFTKPNYYSGVSFSCGAPCTPPPDCSQAANLAGLSSDAGTPSTGAGGGSGAGAGGSGGSVVTGSGGNGGVCSASGATKECSQMVGCSKCSFQSCSCFDGSDCSSGYHTSDGLDFPCDSCPNGCTAAAQAVIAHCGCAQ